MSTGRGRVNCGMGGIVQGRVSRWRSHGKDDGGRSQGADGGGWSQGGDDGGWSQGGDDVGGVREQPRVDQFGQRLTVQPMEEGAGAWQTEVDPVGVETQVEPRRQNLG